MVSAAPLSARASAPVGARPARRIGLADSIAYGLLIVVAGLVFAVSGGVLWKLGINYGGLSGNGVSKIHPSTYLTILLFTWIVATSTNPVATALDLLRRRPGATVLLVSTIIFFAVAVLRRAPGMAGTLDTFLTPALLAMVLARAGNHTLSRLEVLIHLVMCANALLGLFEFASGTLLFPFGLDGVYSPYDLRSTALQGHPLVNATLTCVYVLALLTRGGPALAGWQRMAMIGLQCAALVSFGGRSGMVVTLILGSGALIWSAHEAMMRGRVSPLAAGVAVLGLTLLPLAIGALMQAGFFDQLLDRFVDDDGSANARLVMLDIFGMLSWKDLLVGPDPEWLASVRTLNGLEQGLENPILRTLLVHGLIFTVLMTLAATLFLIEIGRRTGRAALLPMIAFVVLINTFESLGGKTLLLTEFLLLMICFYRPSAARIAGSKTRVSSSA